MKKEIIIISILAILLVNFVSASSFSPSSLTFNLNPGQKQCQSISITSDSSTITINDMWATDKSVAWKVSLFTSSASSHSISIDYPTSLSINQRTVSVCVSGTEIGEYHGVILMKEGQVGNSIVQMGVWLKVVIGSGSTSTNSGTTQTQTTTTTNQATSNATNTTQTTTPQTAQETSDQQANTTQEQIPQTSLMTGGVLGVSLKNTSVLIIFIAIVVIAAIIILGRNKIIGYIKWKKYGY